MIDGWQCCQCDKDSQDPLTEDYYTIGMVALKKKIKEVIFEKF